MQLLRNISKVHGSSAELYKRFAAYRAENLLELQRRARFCFETRHTASVTYMLSFGLCAMFLNTIKKERREDVVQNILRDFSTSARVAFCVLISVLEKPMMDTISTQLGMDVDQCKRNELTASVGLFAKYGKIVPVSALRNAFLQS